MFPRTPVAPDNLATPGFADDYATDGPGALFKAFIFVFRTVLRSFKSVFVAIYWAWKRQFDKVPRPVLTSSIACLLVGALAGAWFLSVRSSEKIQDLQVAVAESQSLLKARQDKKLDTLYAERDRLRQDLLQVTAISRDYPEGSIPQALALAASEEFKIADSLLLQQIAALESGAKVTVAVKQTTPDPDLALTLESEMTRLQNDISRQIQSTQGLTETPKMLADTSIATQMVNLAIPNRNQ